jgi:hypothetical protein
MCEEETDRIVKTAAQLLLTIDGRAIDLINLTKQPEPYERK